MRAVAPELGHAAKYAPVRVERFERFVARRSQSEARGVPSGDEGHLLLEIPHGVDARGGEDVAVVGGEDHRVPLGLRAVKVADGVAVRHDGRALRDPELVRAGSDVDAVHPSPERENQKQGDGRDDCGMKGGEGGEVGGWREREWRRERDGKEEGGVGGWRVGGSAGGGGLC